MDKQKLADLTADLARLLADLTSADAVVARLQSDLGNLDAADLAPTARRVARLLHHSAERATWVADELEAGDQA